MKKAHPKLFSKATVPFTAEPDKNASQILTEMEGISFQGRMLGAGFRVWKEALAEGSTIFLGLSGALVPAGCRKLISFLIEHRLIDVLVSTGANLFHDIHQSMGGLYYRCSPFADDKLLRKERFDRMYDVAASDNEFIQVDTRVFNAAKKFYKKPCSTREFFYLLAEEMGKDFEEEGIVSSAYKAKVPIYCPAIVDSSFGLSLAAGRINEGFDFNFDVVKDIIELKDIIVGSPTTSEIILGGGTPKNFIQQAAVVCDLIGSEAKGFKYCLQITADAPHWGGLSGCTFDESTSWGKIDFEAKKVAVYCDSTIALPFLVQALADEKAWKLRSRIPSFNMGEQLGFTLSKAKDPVPTAV